MLNQRIPPPPVSLAEQAALNQEQGNGADQQAQDGFHNADLHAPGQEGDLLNAEEEGEEGEFYV